MMRLNPLKRHAMQTRYGLFITLLLVFAGPALAQQTQPSDAAGEADTASKPADFNDVSKRVMGQLENANAELSDLRDKIADKKIPLTRKLNKLEQKLLSLRQEFQDKSRTLDTRKLKVSNLKKEIEQRRDQASYLSNLMSEYVRNFETRLHITEMARYGEALEAAKLAPESNELSREEIFARQSRLVELSITRLEEALGGTRFPGSATSEQGEVKEGEFVLVGPAAYFLSDDGSVVGTATETLNSVKPTVRAFKDKAHAETARKLVAGTGDQMPLDPTLGRAHKIASTQATFSVATLVDYFKRGGPVMYPIAGLAVISLLVALYKWLALTLHRMPSQKKIDALLQAVARQDESDARERLKKIKGPTGAMLAIGIDHIRHPRELIEEVMYETVLSTRLKVQRLLPFIAVTASASPLLGLLGTVIGIINTFELITAFGTGDVQTLSGGISEALVTTMFGLVVAIPSLLLYAFLSRKARRITDQMEKVALAFANQVATARSTPKEAAKEPATA